MDIIHWILNLHNSEFLAQMISEGGIAVVVLIVFVETGLLVGFFLPGDSLLITAGVLTSSSAIGGRPLLGLSSLIIWAALAAVVGDQLGFYLGAGSGNLADRKASLRMKKFLEEAKSFFADYGERAIFYARFIPIMRTFVPFAAGLSQMHYRKFFKLNFLSGILWVALMVLIGHFLGKSALADQLHKVLLLVILISVLPVFFTVYKRYFKSNVKVRR